MIMSSCPPQESSLAFYEDKWNGQDSHLIELFCGDADILLQYLNLVSAGPSGTLFLWPVWRPSILNYSNHKCSSKLGWHLAYIQHKEGGLTLTHAEDLSRIMNYFNEILYFSFSEFALPGTAPVSFHVVCLSLSGSEQCNFTSVFFSQPLSMLYLFVCVKFKSQLMEICDHWCNKPIHLN